MPLRPVKGDEEKKGDDVPVIDVDGPKGDPPPPPKKKAVNGKVKKKSSSPSTAVADPLLGGGRGGSGEPSRMRKVKVLDIDAATSPASASQPKSPVGLEVSSLPEVDETVKVTTEVLRKVLPKEMAVVRAAILNFGDFAAAAAEVNLEVEQFVEVLNRDDVHRLYRALQIQVVSQQERFFTESALHAVNILRKDFSHPVDKTRQSAAKSVLDFFARYRQTLQPPKPVKAEETDDVDVMAALRALE